ncbi:MAG: DUF4097 family beta strand repeat-containing protein [Bryobacteraceae bacterium]
MRIWIPVVLAAATTGLATAGTERFDWKGSIAPGQSIEIKGVNGAIRAEPSTGAEVEVIANKSGHRNNPADVRVEVVPHAGGVTICAVYPSSRGQANECKPGHGGRMNVNHNDVKVEFTVRVLSGVRFVGRTVNGDVEAHSLTAFAEAHTVNGRIRLSTAGEAQADTVNGSIDASLGPNSGSNDLKFSSVNGTIHVDLPPALNAQVHASTVNGSISSDFRLLVHGKMSRRSMDATAGNGGRELKLSTVNGSIHLGQAL